MWTSTIFRAGPLTLIISQRWLLTACLFRFVLTGGVLGTITALFSIPRRLLAVTSVVIRLLRVCRTLYLALSHSPARAFLVLLGCAVVLHALSFIRRTHSYLPLRQNQSPVERMRP